MVTLVLAKILIKHDNAKLNSIVYNKIQIKHSSQNGKLQRQKMDKLRTKLAISENLLWQYAGSGNGAHTVYLADSYTQRLND